MTASTSGSGMPVLYYIRHGETDWNVEQRLQGHRDTPLNARGRRQASHCGDILRDLLVRDGRAAVDCAYVSSPLCRARETMQLVRTAVDLEPDIYDVDKRLIEISFGDWEGLTLPEIAGRDAEALAAREQNKWGFTPPGGESYRDVTARVSAWYATVTQDTVVTAHGGVARALIAHFNILPHEGAVHADIVHGVVYVFAGGTMARYS
ncbi:MAG TPA: histidine phosphatase family protein [Xanthobacteraceae bacterium]|nr:histidine phosphatase family protein [Xanthobacteraceae bacterium]